MPLGHSWNTFLNITKKSVTDIQFLEYEFYMILTKVLYKEISISLYQWRHHPRKRQVILNPSPRINPSTPTHITTQQLTRSYSSEESSLLLRGLNSLRLGVWWLRRISVRSIPWLGSEYLHCSRAALLSRSRRWDEWCVRCFGIVGWRVLRFGGCWCSWCWYCLVWFGCLVLLILMLMALMLENASFFICRNVHCLRIVHTVGNFSNTVLWYTTKSIV